MPGHETLMTPPEYCHEGEKYVGVKKQPTALTQEVFDQLSEDQQVRLFKTYPWLKVNGSAIAGTKADDSISRGSFTATQSQTYAKRARDLNMSEPVGDLPAKIVDRVLPKHPEQRNLAVLLYIQRGVEDRLPLAEGEFEKVWALVQIAYAEECARLPSPPAIIGELGPQSGRGLFCVGNEASAVWIKNTVAKFEIEGQRYRVWRQGEDTTRLVTVIIKDKGIAMPEMIPKFLRLCNRLPENSVFHQFKVIKQQGSTTRRVVFGARGELLERLREIRTQSNFLNFCGMEAEFNISPGKSSTHAKTISTTYTGPPRTSTPEPSTSGASAVPATSEPDEDMEEEQSTLTEQNQDHGVYDDAEEETIITDQQVDRFLASIETPKESRMETDQSWADQVEQEEAHKTPRDKALEELELQAHRIEEWSRTKKGEKPKGLLLEELLVKHGEKPN